MTNRKLNSNLKVGEHVDLLLWLHTTCLEKHQTKQVTSGFRLGSDRKLQTEAGKMEAGQSVLV